MGAFFMPERGIGLKYSHTWIKEKSIKIIALGDIHLGSPQSKVLEVAKLIEKSDDKTYFIFVGDVIDNAIIDSVSNVYEQTQSPQKALSGFAELLKLTKGRTLAVVSGNHEERTRRRVGVDLLEVVCSDLSVPYENDIFALDVSVGNGKSGRGSAGRSSYSIVIGHGYTAARTTGGKITANGRIIDVISNADIYITGHTHQPSIVKTSRFEIDSRNKKLMRREMYLITIPAWLGYEKYAARKFMHPGALGVIEIELSGANRYKHIEVRIR